MHLLNAKTHTKANCISSNRHFSYMKKKSSTSQIKQTMHVFISYSPTSIRILLCIYCFFSVCLFSISFFVFSRTNRARVCVYIGTRIKNIQQPNTDVYHARMVLFRLLLLACVHFIDVIMSLSAVFFLACSVSLSLSFPLSFFVCECFVNRFCSKAYCGCFYLLFTSL